MSAFERINTQNYSLKENRTMKNNILMTGLMSLLLIGANQAALGGEVGTGGGGGGVTAGCQPVTSLTAKGDSKIGETGLASVQLGWAVKPCTAGQAVRVVTTITKWSTKEVVYSDENAPLNSKITAFVAVRNTYQCTVTVIDVATGAVEGTSTVYASTVPKGGV